MELREIFDEYYDRVYGFALYRVGDVHVAEDVASEVFYKAAKGWDRYRGEASVSTWLFAIALNEVKMYFRGRQYVAPIEEAENVPACERTEGAVLANEAARELFAAMGGLDERQKDVVVLRYFGGLSGRETARLLGISETNAETILSRAKKLLKNYLENSQGNV
ncbi:MAG: RNA polymerase sigma factor [Clostridiales bacterium]|nr:RNA polymerase sigma factor [Clostridiales bacterium]